LKEALGVLCFSRNLLEKRKIGHSKPLGDLVDQKKLTDLDVSIGHTLLQPSLSELFVLSGCINTIRKKHLEISRANLNDTLSNC
jgi:hypothetical protein